MQARAELEERLNIAIDFDTAIKGKTSELGTRNFTVEEPKIKMIWCPPATFTMGSPAEESGRTPEETLHQVTLTKGFWLGMYPLTQEKYSVIADCAGLRARPANFGGLRRPVETVDWYSVERWCKELTYLEMIAGRLPDGYEYRLPTEADFRPKRSGNMPAAQELPPPSTMAWIPPTTAKRPAPTSKTSRGTSTIPDTRRTSSANASRTHGASATCTATSANGAGTGSAKSQRTPPRIRTVPNPVN